MSSIAKQVSATFIEIDIVATDESFSADSKNTSQLTSNILDTLRNLVDGQEAFKMQSEAKEQGMWNINVT